MFHHRLLELESELLAKEECAREFETLPVECQFILDEVENEIGAYLGGKVPKNWHGWLCYKRKNALVICHGRSFADGIFFKTWRAGIDCQNGLDSITEYRRGFDVTPAQEVDHLFINFGAAAPVRVFLWYGENIAPYKLVFEANVDSEPLTALQAAIVEACVWILKRPKNQTLTEFLKLSENSNSG